MKLLALLFGFCFAAISHSVGAEPALRAVDQSITGGGGSFVSGVSSGGRFVAFLSNANNLTTTDSLNPWLDLFLRDLYSGTTALISVDSSGQGGGNENSSMASVSADGRWVAFASAADNLVAGDTNRATDVFLRDVLSGETRLVSAGLNGKLISEDSDNPWVSVDGRYVIYETRSANGVSSGSNGFPGVLRYDALQRSNILVSVPWTSAEAGFTSAGPAHSPSASMDGNWVAYAQVVTNILTDGPAISRSEVLLRDVRGAESFWVSSGAASHFQFSTAFACYNPAISGDGGSVVFKASDGRPVATLFRHVRIAGLTSSAQPIAVNAVTQGWAQVSYDGRFVAYEATDGIRLWDAVANSNRLVMANLSGESARWCSSPSMSSNGNVTVFVVSSNGFDTVYHHDYETDRTTPVLWRPNDVSLTVADPIISSEGNQIVFNSVDDSLTQQDSNRAHDVFAFDIGSGVMSLVSSRDQFWPSVTPPNSSGLLPGSISANGRYVSVLTRTSGNVDADVLHDFYIRDLSTGDLRTLGLRTNPVRYCTFSANGRYVAFFDVSLDWGAFWPWFSPVFQGTAYRFDMTTNLREAVGTDAIWRIVDARFAPTPIAISPDGSKVAFVSRSVVPFNNGFANLFMRDFEAGNIQLISIGIGSDRDVTVPGNHDSFEPVFSPDGRWLLFRSSASNLTTDAQDGYGLFARDLVGGRTVLVSLSHDPEGIGARSMSISANSRIVASVGASPLEDARVYDLINETSTGVVDSQGARCVSLCGDGRWIAFDRRALETAHWSIYVRDLFNHSNELVTVQYGSTNPVTASSSHPQISHDGRYVVFASDATNIVAGDNNNAKDIFIRDRWRNVTMLASVNRTGTGSGNGASLLPVLAADGRTLLFQSFASDLIEGDFNETADVFILRLGGADTDGDAMDDDWEVAYFGNLARDGAGDFDGDGSTDGQEHQLGTDPTNVGSVFHVLKLTREGGNGIKLLWAATPGRAYRIEFKDDLASAQWNAASETVTAAGTTAAWTESAGEAAAHRFYRVVLAP